MWAWVGKVVLGPLFGFFRDLVGDWQKQKEAESLGTAKQAQSESQKAAEISQEEGKAIANQPKNQTDEDKRFDSGTA